MTRADHRLSDSGAPMAPMSISSPGEPASPAPPGRESPRPEDGAELRSAETDAAPSAAPPDPIVSPDLLQIGDAAARVGLSIRTLRHWEEVGLVTPTARSKGRFRLYSPDDLRRLLVVKSMKPMGFALEEMATLLSLVEEARAFANRGEPMPCDTAKVLGQYVVRTGERIERIMRDLGDAHDLLAMLESGLSGESQCGSP